MTREPEQPPRRRPQSRRAPGPLRDRSDAEQAASAVEPAAAAEHVEATVAGTLAGLAGALVPEPAEGTVRATVDVPLAHHRQLNRLADDVAEDLAVASVTRQDLLAAAVAELLERDPFSDELRRRITARVRQLQQARE